MLQLIAISSTTKAKVEKGRKVAMNDSFCQVNHQIKQA